MLIEKDDGVVHIRCVCVCVCVVFSFFLSFFREISLRSRPRLRPPCPSVVLVVVLRVVVAGRGSRPVGGQPLPLVGGLEDLEGAHEGLVDRHDGGRVVELPAVVRGREEGDELPAGEELVPVLHHLVGPADQIQIVLVEKGADDVLPEGEGDAPVVLPPAVDLLVGIGPDDVAEQAGVGDVRRALDVVDLLEGGQLRAETAVDAEDLLVDDGTAREAVEDVREGLPELDGMPALALVVKAVDPVDRGALVVPPEDEEVLGVLDLVGQDQAGALEALLAPVDVVTQKQVVRVRGKATVLEDPEHVVVLPVGVPDDLEGCRQLQEHRLSHDDVPGADADHLDLRRRQVDVLSGPRPADAARKRKPTNQQTNEQTNRFEREKENWGREADAEESEFRGENQNKSGLVESNEREGRNDPSQGKTIQGKSSQGKPSRDIHASANKTEDHHPSPNGRTRTRTTNKEAEQEQEEKEAEQEQERNAFAFSRLSYCSPQELLDDGIDGIFDQGSLRAIAILFPVWIGRHCIVLVVVVVDWNRIRIGWIQDRFGTMGGGSVSVPLPVDGWMDGSNAFGCFWRTGGSLLWRTTTPTDDDDDDAEAGEERDRRLTTTQQTPPVRCVCVCGHKLWRPKIREELFSDSNLPCAIPRGTNILYTQYTHTDTSHTNTEES